MSALVGAIRKSFAGGGGRGSSSAKVQPINNGQSNIIPTQRQGPNSTQTSTFNNHDEAMDQVFDMNTNNMNMNNNFNNNNQNFGPVISTQSHSADSNNRKISGGMASTTAISGNVTTSQTVTSNSNHGSGNGGAKGPGGPGGPGQTQILNHSFVTNTATANSAAAAAMQQQQQCNNQQQFGTPRTISKNPQSSMYSQQQNQNQQYSDRNHQYSDREINSNSNHNYNYNNNNNNNNNTNAFGPQISQGQNSGHWSGNCSRPSWGNTNKNQGTIGDRGAVSDAGVTSNSNYGNVSTAQTSGQMRYNNGNNGNGNHGSTNQQQNYYNGPGPPNYNNGNGNPNQQYNQQSKFNNTGNSNFQFQGQLQYQQQFQTPSPGQMSPQQRISGALYAPSTTSGSNYNAGPSGTQVQQPNQNQQQNFNSSQMFIQNNVAPGPVTVPTALIVSPGIPMQLNTVMENKDSIMRSADADNSTSHNQTGSQSQTQSRSIGHLNQKVQTGKTEESEEKGAKSQNIDKDGKLEGNTANVDDDKGNAVQQVSTSKDRSEQKALTGDQSQKDQNDKKQGPGGDDTAQNQTTVDAKTEVVKGSSDKNENDKQNQGQADNQQKKTDTENSDTKKDNPIGPVATDETKKTDTSQPPQGPTTTNTPTAIAAAAVNPTSNIVPNGPSSTPQASSLPNQNLPNTTQQPLSTQAPQPQPPLTKEQQNNYLQHGHSQGPQQAPQQQVQQQLQAQQMPQSQQQIQQQQFQVKDRFNKAYEDITDTWFLPQDDPEALKIRDQIETVSLHSNPTVICSEGDTERLRAQVELLNVAEEREKKMGIVSFLNVAEEREKKIGIYSSHPLSPIQAARHMALVGLKWQVWRRARRLRMEERKEKQQQLINEKMQQQQQNQNLSNISQGHHIHSNTQQQSQGPGPGMQQGQQSMGIMNQQQQQQQYPLNGQQQWYPGPQQQYSNNLGYGNFMAQNSTQSQPASYVYPNTMSGNYSRG